MTRVDDARRRLPRLPRARARARRLLPAGDAARDGRDLRALVVGGRVLAAIERVGPGWRANLARGAEARPAELSAEQERVCVEAAEALGADYAGVDLCTPPTGATTCSSSTGSPAGTGCRRRPAPTWRGARRARRGGRQRSSASSRGPMTPPCSAVETSAPAAPAARERAQVPGVAHAAAGEQLEVGEGGVDPRDQRRRRARRRCPTRARSSTIASRRPGALQPRHGVERRQARELRVGRQQCGRRAGPRSGSGRRAAREQPVERAGRRPASRSRRSPAARRGPAAPAPAPAR